MRSLAFVLLAACAAGCASQPPLTEFTADSGRARTPEQLAVTFESADLTLRVDPRRRTIEGDAALTVRATAPVSGLAVDLDRNLRIESIAVDGAAVSGWTNPEGRIAIPLATPLAAGESATVRIRYGGKPHVAKRAPWDGGFVWAKTTRGQPWIATALQGEGCDLFWPCIDHPMGEPKRVDLHITVPAPLVAASNGIQTGMDEKDGWRTYHWRTRDPNTYAIALNIAPYELMTAEYRSRFGNAYPLHFYYLKENEAKARELFTEFPRMLDFFESTIGPYPFADEKMGVAETPHLGMEHQTINAYGNGYAKGPDGFDWLLQHEFAHEWFGNQLTNRDWDDMWLHEGFGSYMGPLYSEYLLGDRGYFAALARTRPRIRNKGALVSGESKTEEAVYRDDRGGPGGDIYDKGSYLLHALRSLIGDEAFFRAVRRLVYGTEDPRPGNFAPRYADTAEFAAIVNDVTGRDYGWFFDVYVRSAALPELVVTRDETGLALSWKTEGDRPFPMPVEVRVANRLETAPMTDGHGRIALAPHETFTIDPHSRLLRHEPNIEAFRKWDEQQRRRQPRR